MLSFEYHTCTYLYKVLNLIIKYFIIEKQNCYDNLIAFGIINL